MGISFSVFDYWLRCFVSTRLPATGRYLGTIVDYWHSRRSIYLTIVGIIYCYFSCLPILFLPRLDSIRIHVQKSRDLFPILDSCRGPNNDLRALFCHASCVVSETESEHPKYYTEE